MKPILADFFADFMRNMSRKYGLTGSEQRAALAVLEGASKYVFPKRTTGMSEQAVKAPEKLAPFLTLPAQWSWIEFVEPDEGALINAKDDLKRGNAIYALREKGIFTLANAPFDLDRGGFQKLDDDSPEIALRFQRRFMGAITLLGAPDLLERRAVQHSRKWNAAREAKGKMTFADHDVIDLHLTRYEKDVEREWNDRKLERGEGATGRRVRHHFVRSHIRITNRGKVVKIPPHYRGDPALGEAPTTHIVRP